MIHRRSSGEDIRVRLEDKSEVLRSPLLGTIDCT